MVALWESAVLIKYLLINSTIFIHSTLRHFLTCLILFCNSFYGAGIWFNWSKWFFLLVWMFRIFLLVWMFRCFKECFRILKCFGSNLACHFLSTFAKFECLQFLLWFSKFQSNCFDRFEHYFIQNSHYRHDLNNILWRRNVHSKCSANDSDAIVSRIYFIQHKEQAVFVFLHLWN